MRGSRQTLLVCLAISFQFDWKTSRKVIFISVPKRSNSCNIPINKGGLDTSRFSRKNISVLPMGLTIPRGVKKYNKEKGKTLIFLGRLNKQKGIEDALSAFRSLSKENIVDRLWVVGSGSEEYVKELKNSVKDLSASSVVFLVL